MHLNLTISTPSDVGELLSVFETLYPKYTVFCLHGDLGAGKTTYIKQICQHLGVEGEMSSPSFALVNEYWSESIGQILHFDLYRLKHPEELLDIGWQDYLMSDGLLFIEWPENGGALIPDDAFHILIEHSEEDDSRRLILTDQPTKHVKRDSTRAI